MGTVKRFQKVKITKILTQKRTEEREYYSMKHSSIGIF